MRADAIAMVLALIVTQVSPAAAQSFEERWSIIPKAHADPLPPHENQQSPDGQAQSPRAPQAKNRSQDSSARTFSGKASFYAYSKRKTASGVSFDRNLPTAAHRTLPFGTRVRVTNLANNKSVVVIINDRGPRVRGRVLDLSLAAARTLRIAEDRGIANVRAEVL